MPDPSGQLKGVISAITVGMIAESLTSVHASTDMDAARSIMKEKRFDVLGVHDDQNRITSYFENTHTGSGSVESGVKAIETIQILSWNACLEDHIRDIYKQNRLFILDDKGITGIVTVADLQKIPVRIMFYGIISLLEMSLRDWIAKNHSQNTWKNKISPGRVKMARKLYEERQRVNQEIDLIDCLQLCDKSNILIKSNNLSVKQLGFDSNKKMGKYFDKIQIVRNCLAHAQVLNQELTWAEIAELTQKAKQIMGILSDRQSFGVEGKEA